METPNSGKAKSGPKEPMPAGQLPLSKPDAPNAFSGPPTATQSDQKHNPGWLGVLMLLIGFAVFMCLFTMSSGSILLALPMVLLLVFGWLSAERIFGHKPSLWQVVVGIAVVILVVFILSQLFRGSHGSVPMDPDGLRLDRRPPPE